MVAAQRTQRLPGQLDVPPLRPQRRWRPVQVLPERHLVAGRHRDAEVLRHRLDALQQLGHAVALEPARRGVQLAQSAFGVVDAPAPGGPERVLPAPVAQHLAGRGLVDRRGETYRPGCIGLRVHLSPVALRNRIVT
ncbi:hypothetical protein [uncultured Pseudonocardia sp.]|uniref:hypothetical protein n=1 Tax=uncultured Pseudonocardia sp. TaxID=211455 RepID=UPI0026016B5A|nr:hypothetical protein [uncultured Pseudonocardia sp.]